MKIFTRDLDKVNRKTFIVLLSSIHFEIQNVDSPEKRKKLWTLMDKLLMRHFSDIKNDKRASFIVVGAFTQLRNLITELNFSVREIITSLVRFNIETKLQEFTVHDLILSLSVLSSEDPPSIPHLNQVLHLIIEKQSSLIAKDRTEIE